MLTLALASVVAALLFILNAWFNVQWLKPCFLSMVEALIFFRLLLSDCLNWKIYCDDHSLLSSITAVHIYELFRIYITSFHSSREDMNSIN